MIYNTLSDATYAQYRLAFISQVEGVKPLAYYDSKNIPTIGLGFDLRDNSRVVKYLDEGTEAQ